VPTEEAIETILTMLRDRMLTARREHRCIRATARTNMRPNSLEDDGSFEFTLLIEPRGVASPAPRRIT
jgi:hypothetical protein